MTPEELAAIAEDLLYNGGGSSEQLPEVPGYQLERAIGRGGTSTVYRGRRTTDNALVAIKVVSASHARDAHRRATREAEILQAMTTPFTPRMHATIEIATGVAIISELIKGSHIDVHADAAGMSASQRAALLADAADATAACHELGLIHRDLKPSNILIRADGTPVIIDFGIAAITHIDPTETVLAITAGAGTPAFMPPEQADETAGPLSTRTDIWALGAIGYVLLTGQPPHRLDPANPLVSLRRIMESPPRDPRSITPGLPAPLAAVLMQACDPQPRRRYASAALLAEDLRRWSRGEPTAAQPPGVWTTATRWAGRHPLATTAIACVLLILSTLAGTAGIVHHLTQRPDGIEVSPTGDEAFIISRSGTRLATLAKASGTDAWLIAESVDLTGGRWLAAVSAPTNNSNAKQISLWDPHDLTEPIWTAPRPGPFPPLAIPCYGNDDDQSRHGYDDSLIVADVFADSPGDELIVFSVGRPNFPSALRVFDTDGTLLYRIWIPGNTGIHWLPGTKTIVYAGANNRLETSAPRGVLMPQIVATIRPQLGAIHDRWLTFGIPDSPTNADACLEIIQPATHDPTYATDPDKWVAFYAAPHKAEAAFDASTNFTLWLTLTTESMSRADVRVPLDHELIQSGQIIGNNAIEADQALWSMIVDQWNTDELGLRESVRFDPNPRPIRSTEP